MLRRFSRHTLIVVLTGLMLAALPAMAAPGATFGGGDVPTDVVVGGGTGQPVDDPVTPLPYLLEVLGRILDTIGSLFD